MIQRKSYRASHILVEYIEDAEYILEELSKGDEFEDLAKEFSECDTAKKGGKLGIIFPGQMDAEFERALSKLEIGEISNPVKTKFGFHIIKRQ